MTDSTKFKIIVYPTTEVLANSERQHTPEGVGIIVEVGGTPELGVMVEVYEGKLIAYLYGDYSLDNGGEPVKVVLCEDWASTQERLRLERIAALDMNTHVVKHTFVHERTLSVYFIDDIDPADYIPTFKNWGAIAHVEQIIGKYLRVDCKSKKDAQRFEQFARRLTRADAGNGNGK